MITLRRIIPNVWDVFQSHGLQDPNQSKKDLTKGVSLLSQMACSLILCNCFNFTTSVDLGTAGDVHYSIDTSLLK